MYGGKIYNSAARGTCTGVEIYNSERCATAISQEWRIPGLVQLHARRNYEFRGHCSRQGVFSPGLGLMDAKNRGLARDALALGWCPIADWRRGLPDFARGLPMGGGAVPKGGKERLPTSGERGNGGKKLLDAGGAGAFHDRPNPALQLLLFPHFQNQTMRTKPSGPR